MAAKPKLKVNITERDLGMRHFLSMAAQLRKRPFVKVGVTQRIGSRVRADGKKTVADIAQIHEFGAPKAGIPERSFIRSTVEHNQEKYNQHIEVMRDKIFDANSGIDVRKALSVIGQEVAADMKNTIRQGIPPELKRATIMRKNAGQIEKAQSTLRGLERKAKFTKADIKRENKASDMVLTGGDSTPLINTGTLVNSLSYEVVMDGASQGAGSALASGTEGPKAF